MNCIILLLLLSCGGWGSSCGSSNCGSGCGRSQQGERNGCGCSGGRESRGGRNSDRMAPDGRRSERRSEDCGCEEERSSRGNNDCGCGQRESENRDSSGMIPPPWQDYPKFPRRDDGDDCDD